MSHRILDWDRQDTVAWDAGPLLGSLSRVYGGKLADRIGGGWVTLAVFVGFAGAVGALGGVGINLALRQSYLSSGSATSAFWIFLAFYTLASVMTWAMYVRRPSSARVTVAEPRPELARRDRHVEAMAG